LKTELERAKKNLDHATPGDVRRGLNSIRRICADYRINGVFGPLVELVDCDEKFFTAVEVTAGNRYAGNLLSLPHTYNYCESTFYLMIYSCHLLFYDQPV
jgi:hypothetical protein